MHTKTIEGLEAAISPDQSCSVRMFVRRSRDTKAVRKREEAPYDAFPLHTHIFYTPFMKSCPLHMICAHDFTRMISPIWDEIMGAHDFVHFCTFSGGASFCEALAALLRI